jgi:hypothetical protein
MCYLNATWEYLWPKISKILRVLHMLVLLIRKFYFLEKQWSLKWARIMWKTLFDLTTWSCKNWRAALISSGKEDQDQNDFIHNSEMKEVGYCLGDSEGIDLRTHSHKKNRSIILQLSGEMDFLI